MQSTEITIAEPNSTIECEPNCITNIIIHNDSTNVIVNLSQEHAQCNIYGVQLGYSNKDFNINIIINHKAPNCYSNTILRGVYTDKSNGNINARIYVHPHAVKTNANLENKNLLLSNTATVNTIPQLEIYNDDVQCSHGATVGDLDTEALFYLQSRGIQQADAKKILIESFVSPALFNKYMRHYAQEQLSNF